MSCFHPILMFDTGLKTDKGKRLLVRSSPKELFQGEFLSAEYIEKVKRVSLPPSLLRDPEYYKEINGRFYCVNSISTPCGQCLGCQLEKSRQWAVRCFLEASLYDQNCFVTLTYDDQHLPKDFKVDKLVLSNFIRKLRKKFGDGIRFFGCGEYGEKSLRPHYHVILFNFRPKDLVPYKLSKSGENLYVSKTLSDIWPFGFAVVGDCTFESAAYVARYCVKKHDCSDDFKPFLLMSRRPGIGRFYYDLNKENMSTGHLYKKIGDRPINRLPKYFLNLLDKDGILPKGVNQLLLDGKMFADYFATDFDGYCNYMKSLEDLQVSKAERLKRLL